uniref:Uncharacterized protein n=1 Tax=Caenorhabditis tropicalis TaxID=1561998 RepID=A0A1I7T8E7_9PELO
MKQSELFHCLHDQRKSDRNSRQTGALEMVHRLLCFQLDQADRWTPMDPQETRTTMLNTGSDTNGTPSGPCCPECGLQILKSIQRKMDKLSYNTSRSERATGRVNIKRYVNTERDEEYTGCMGAWVLEALR